jgi:hypothetical protein
MDMNLVMLVAAVLALLAASWTAMIEVKKAWKRRETALAATVSDLQGGFSRQLNEYASEIEAIRQRADAAVGNAKADFLNRLAVYQAVILDAVPVISKMGSLQEGTSNGDWAAKWLYLVNCMGLWLPHNGESRLVARGQTLAAFRPTEVAKMVDRLKAAQAVSDLEAKTEVPAVALRNDHKLA